MGWRRQLANVVVGGAGALVAVNTQTQTPSYLLNPGSTAAAAGLSGLALVATARKDRRSLLVTVPHAANLVVQFYQAGRWAAAPSIKDPSKPRTRVVVLGSGWGAASFLKTLDRRLTGDDAWYDITVVSPNNFFQYTPLLPGAVTGSVEMRSIIESTRHLLEGKGAYLQAECLDVDPDKKVLQCRYNKPSRGNPQEHYFELPYDLLVCAVGAVSNTFHTPGVEEHAFFLKEARHAEQLRARINECLELASLPGTTTEQRTELLTFCVVGGGPTGVEIAAEMHDLFDEDLLPRFPHLREHVHVKLIETRDHILSAFDRHISEFADQQFARQGIEASPCLPLMHDVVVYNSRVKAVERDGVVLTVKDKEGPVKLTAGTTVWCTGIKMNPMVAKIISKMPAGQQANSKAAHVDHYLAVKGSGDAIYAIGDAATLDQEHVLDHAEELFKQADVDKNGKLSPQEVRGLIRDAKNKYPQLAEHALQLDIGPMSLMDELGETVEHLVDDTSSYLPTWMQSGKKTDQEAAQVTAAAAAAAEGARGAGKNEPQGITQEDFRARLEAIDKNLRALPATAQVASQQGKYLGGMFNAHRMLPAPPADLTLREAVEPFDYHHLGTFAYVGGDQAVLELPTNGEEQGYLTGMLCGLLWKSAESFMQISLVNKYMVARDWMKVKMFGRDISDA